MSVYPCGSQPVWWLGLNVAMGKCTSLLLCFVNAVLTEIVLTMQFSSSAGGTSLWLQGMNVICQGLAESGLALAPGSFWSVLLPPFACPAAYLQPLCSLQLCHQPSSFSDIAWSHCCAIDGKKVMVRLKESWLQLTFLYKTGAINFRGDL